MADDKHDANPYESSTAPPTVAPGNPALVLLGKLFLGGVVLFIAAAMLLPLTRGVGGMHAARRVQCQNQVKQIVLAMHNYADEHGAFPPAYTVDEDGNRLHSWRTLLLPYLEEKALYDSIDLTKPWDDPVNQQARETVLDFYMCPSADHEEGMTTYLVVTGAGYVFDGPNQVGFDGIPDGASKTILVVDVDGKHAVPWMSPDDITLDEFCEQSLEKRSQHPHVTQVGFADGRARAVNVELSREYWEAMLTIAGGEDLGE